jgi:hypothetical protein
MRFPVVPQESVSLSSPASRINEFLEFLAQEMVAQDHFARSHARNGLNPSPNLLTDTGGKPGGTQRAGQMEMNSDLASLNEYLVEKSQFAQ